MSWPNVADDDGYRAAPNKNRPGNDISWSDDIDLEACKAACNSDQACKSIAYGNSGTRGNRNCWLKRWTESEGGAVDDSVWTTYYKQGEPANDKRVYFTKNIPTAPNNSWRETGSLYERTVWSTEDDCDMHAKKVGEFDIYDVTTCRCSRPGCTGYGDCRKKDVLCTRVPRSTKMCPDLSRQAGNKDLRYFRHFQLNRDPTIKLTGADYRGAFTQRGTRLHDTQDIICGYNRIDKRHFPNLKTYFNENEIVRIVRDHCFGSGIDSVNLNNDTDCRSALNIIGRESEIDGEVLKKLATESGWWNDNIKVGIFENIATVRKQGLETQIVNVINSLPATGWSDRLVNCLNALVDPGTQSHSTVLTKIEEKTKAYCVASNANTNEKCACYNAIEKGLSGCTDSIKGCEEAVLYEKALNELTQSNSTLASSIRSNYVPQINAKACRRTTKTDTVLRYKNAAPGAMAQNLAMCYSKIENSGTINADTIKAVCSAQVTTTDDSGDSGEPSAASVAAAASGDSSKKMMWIIIAIIVFCFMAAGLGLVLISSSSGGGSNSNSSN